MSTSGRWAGFWFVIVVCFGFVAYVGWTGPRTSTSSTMSSTADQTRPQISPSVAATAQPRIGLFVGDSYVAGTAMVDQQATFAPRTCNRLGMICYYDAQPGTGYLAEGTEAASGSYAARLRADRNYTPDLVVVEGGRADLGAGPVTEAATSYLKALKKQFRTAKVVVLEPFWNNTTPPATVLTLRSEVQAAAGAAGVDYVPTAGWLNDALMARDGITPTADGHRTLATKLVPVLREVLAG